MKKVLISIFAFALSCLWFSACASGGGSSGERGLTVEDGNAEIAVYPQLGHGGAVNSVTFSPDGKQVLSGAGDGTVKLWDIASGLELRAYSGDDGVVASIAFSSDGKQVLSVSQDYSGFSTKLWDMASGREIKTFKGELYGVSAAFSPDGKQMLTGSQQDKNVKLWDTASGRVIRTFRGHTAGVNSVAFSPDGKQVLSSCSVDKTIKLWDAANGREIRTFSGVASSVAFSPDGKQVLSGSGGPSFDGIKDFTVKLWDAASGQEIRTFSGHKDDITSLAFSPDGKQALSGSGPKDRTVKLWDIASGQEIRTFSGHTSQISSVAFSPDGKKVLSSCSIEDTVKLWDVASGQEIRTFSGHTAGVSSVAFSPDGKQILSGSRDTTVKLWDIASGYEIRTFSGHAAGVNSVAFSPDGKQALSGSDDKTIKLWDTASGREIRTFSGHSRLVTSVTFSPDGKQILSGDYGNTMKLWDTASGREIRTWNTDWVNSVAFSPDGKQVLSGSYDKTMKLWDIASGREIRTFSGHTSGVNSVTFSPDGKRVLSGSSDGTIRIWDVSTGKEIVQFIYFSGSDSQLASASRNLTVVAENAVSSNEGEWLAITPDGYYQASPRGDRYLNVRVGNTVSGIDSYRAIFYNPDVVQARLQNRPDPKNKATVTIQEVVNFLPPVVTILSPANYSTTNTGTANLSVAIFSQSQPLQSIKIIVNGGLLGSSDLATVKGSGLQPQKASLAVTGNQKTVNFNLPISLNPGVNTIEVVAFNGYTESPRFPIEVTWNAPANQKPTLPNLWILAVGVNNYQDSGINNLSYCVADAKGVIESLKAQEGKRYAKVNSLLVADGEAVPPTAANIRQRLSFFDQAGERDVVLLFLAGHGVSNNAGQFLFLPSDTRLNADKSVNADTAITDADIVNVLDRAGNLLVFIDACQSGGVDNDRLVRSLMETNAFVFTSSCGNELSQERQELGHGVFTYSVMQGLKGATQALAQGNVTVLSLSGFVTLDVPRITGGAQNPKAYSLGFYDFPMAVIK